MLNSYTFPLLFSSCDITSSSFFPVLFQIKANKIQMGSFPGWGMGQAVVRT